MTIDKQKMFTAIRECPWFSVVPDDDIRRLADCAQIRRYRTHQFLYMVGEVQQNLFCVLTGRIRVNVTSSGGQEFVMANLQGGAWLGEAAIVGTSSRTLEAKVDEAADILVLPAAAVTMLAKEIPDIYRCFFEDTMARSKLLYELMAGMLFLPLKSRLAGRLLWLAENYGATTSEGVEVKMRLNQTDFANMTMGSRQRVNKIFREWVADRILERRGDYYVVRDMDALMNAFIVEGND